MDVRAEFLKVTNEKVQKASEAAFNQTKPKQTKTQYTQQEPQTTPQPRRLPWYKPVPAQSSGEEPYYIDTGRGHGVHGKEARPRKVARVVNSTRGKSAKAKAAKAAQSRLDKRRVKTE